MHAAGSPTTQAERPRYPWLSSGYSRAQWAAAITALVTGIGLAFLYLYYSRTNDVSPDSLYGYGFAIAGTVLLLLVGVGYVLRKRLLRHWGRLHTFLAWHMVGGLLGLLLILMHAAGNFNMRTGTYALWGLIGVVISGLIGRVFDRFAPRLAAKAALQAVSASGEERLDALEQELGVMVSNERARQEALRQSGAQGAPWDLAYYDLDPQLEEIPALLSQGVRSDTGPILDLRQISGPLAAQPARRIVPAASRQITGEVIRQAAALQRALGREQFFLSLVRVWRRVHLLVSLIALGLLLWHLEYATVLLMNAR